MEVRLNLVEEAPGPRALRGQQAAPVLEAAPGPARHRAEAMEVAQQGLGRRRVGPDGRPRRVVGDPQHQRGIGQHQLAGRLGAGDIHLRELPDLPGREAMRGDRGDEAGTGGRVGARQRDEVFHRGVGRAAAGPDFTVDRGGQIAHQGEPARDPARGLVKPPREIGERQREARLERIEHPPLLERADRIGGAHQLLEDQRLGFLQLPAQRPHRVVGQPGEGTEALIAIDHDEALGGGHDHDRQQLAVLGQRGQELALLAQIPLAQRFVPTVELVKFKSHGPP